MRHLILFLSLLLTSPSFLQKQTPTHGTINVLLANRNGIVLVTDSRTSNPEGQPINDVTRKLFQIDSSTVCSMAGFGTDPGPGNAIQESAGGQITSVIEALRRNHPSLSFQDKVSLLTYTLASSLIALETEYAVAAPPSKRRPVPQPLFLLFAGINSDGSKLIAKVSITIERGRNAEFPDFKPKIDAKILPVNNDLVYLTAGADTTVEVRLEGPGAFPAEPALKDYAQAFHQGQTSNMTVQQMQNLALYLKDEAARVFRWVGGNPQEAIYQNQQFQIIVPSDLREYTAPYTTGLVFNTRIADSPALPLVAPTPHSIYVGNLCSNAAVPLDGTVLIGGSYTNCNFFYDGGDFYVDPTVVLQGGTLILGKHVSLDSYLVEKVLGAMPQLKPVPYTKLKDADQIAKRFWNY